MNEVKVIVRGRTRSVSGEVAVKTDAPLFVIDRPNVNTIAERDAAAREFIQSLNGGATR